VFLAVDREDDLVEVPFVAELARATADLPGKILAE
jgi:hypothetical protein